MNSASMLLRSTRGASTMLEAIWWFPILIAWGIAVTFYSYVALFQVDTQRAVGGLARQSTDYQRKGANGLSLGNLSQLSSFVPWDAIKSLQDFSEKSFIEATVVCAAHEGEHPSCVDAPIYEGFKELMGQYIEQMTGPFHAMYNSVTELQPALLENIVPYAKARMMEEAASFSGFDQGLLHAPPPPVELNQAGCKIIEGVVGKPVNVVDQVRKFQQLPVRSYLSVVIGQLDGIIGNFSCGQEPHEKLMKYGDEAKPGQKEFQSLGCLAAQPDLFSLDDIRRIAWGGDQVEAPSDLGGFWCQGAEWYGAKHSLFYTDAVNRLNKVFCSSTVELTSECPPGDLGCLDKAKAFHELCKIGALTH